MKITSPDKAFTGTSMYGSTTLKFRDGAADHDGDLPAGVRLYLQSAGYGIDSEATTPAAAEIPDPRDVDGTLQLGSPLRDAAVNPRPEDYGVPVNAGKEGQKGNPHGPNVVSMQAVSPRSGNPPKVDGEPGTA